MKTRSKATQILRAMLARRYGFGASPNKQRPGLCGHGGIACHLATPPKWRKKRRLLLLNLRFSGFLEPFGCGLHNNKLFLIHRA